MNDKVCEGRILVRLLVVDPQEDSHQKEAQHQRKVRKARENQRGTGAVMVARC